MSGMMDFAIVGIIMGIAFTLPLLTSGGKKLVKDFIDDIVNGRT